jgi:hypothetical protein
MASTKGKKCTALIFCILTQCILADVYMHNPRGR